MSRRNRNRAIAPAALETPERDAEPLATPEDDVLLEEREEGDEEEEADDEDEEAPATTAPEPAPRSEREVRLAAARALKPEASHWQAMWLTGRDAAVTALEGGLPIASVYALAPPQGAGCRDCWARGRDAVLRMIQGV